MINIEPHVIETLKKFDSATIANVIELFDIRSRVAGYTGAKIKAIYPTLPPAVGFAVTATFRSGYAASNRDAYGGMGKLLQAAMTLPTPRFVVFQDLDSPSRAATYGEIMASSFQAFGFAGLITSGAARDIEQVRAMKFPCFAESVIVAHGYCRIVDINVPVWVDGLEVRPGNLLHADANGVVDIPTALAGEVAALCQPYVDAENLIIASVRGSRPTLEGYNAAVMQCKDRFKALAEQAQSARDRLLPSGAREI